MRYTVKFQGPDTPETNDKDLEKHIDSDEDSLCENPRTNHGLIASETVFHENEYHRLDIVKGTFL